MELPPSEPAIVSCAAFIDGQNLFYAVKDCFGYDYPNYDIKKLVTKICEQKDWDAEEIHFYTGIPKKELDPTRFKFWEKKLAVMGTRGIKVYTRELKYSEKDVVVDGKIEKRPVPREKGIDVKLTIDVIRAALSEEFDAILLFSQDQDFTELIREVKSIYKDKHKFINIACAYPFTPKETTDDGKPINKIGIHGAVQIQISKLLYDQCIDPNTYRSKT